MAALVLPAACGGRPWQHLGSGWRQVTSDHFLLHTDADLDDVTPIVDLDRAINQLHRQVYTGVGGPGSRRSLAVTLKKRWSGPLGERPVDPAVIK